jgi:hypothetical protein
MNNHLDIKPEEVFKDLNSLLSKSITITVDLSRREKSFYLHDYIKVLFTKTRRIEPAFRDLFEEHVKDQLNHAHKRYRDHFNRDEFQDIIYNWITKAIEEFEKGNAIKLRVKPVNPEEEVRTFRISNVDELRSTQSYVTNEEYEHLKHLIDQREKMMHFLKDWEYESPLNDVLFHFKLYPSSVILLLLGLMKAGRLRLSNNLKGDIDIESFKRFIVNKVRILPKDPATTTEKLGWNDLITPSDSNINRAIKGYKFDLMETVEDLLDVKYLENNRLNNHMRTFLIEAQKKLQERDQG